MASSVFDGGSPTRAPFLSPAWKVFAFRAFFIGSLYLDALKVLQDLPPPSTLVLKKPSNKSYFQYLSPV